MNQIRHRVLGPLQAGEGSRAALGLQIGQDGVPRAVVLVLAPPEVNADVEAAKALARETERAVILEHPNIIRVYGLTVIDEAGKKQGLARVTEFADGESLRRVLELARLLPPKLGALIVADLAMGVHYAHVAGNDDGSPMVHGDIRPETVLISFAGVTKATGYGALGVAPKEANGRRVVNRRRYSAPEQVVSGRAAVIVQSDVFLLGLLLHECLAGQQPWADAEDHDQAILTQPLEALPSTVPEELQKVVQRATAKKASERYPTAIAFREAILSAVGELPPQEDLAALLESLFPDVEGIRAKRKQMIDAGIARYAKEQWARATTLPETPATAAALTEPAVPVAAPPSAPQRPAAAAPRAAVPVAVEPPPPPAAKGAFLAPVIVGLGAAALAIGAFVFLNSEKPQQAEPVAAVVIDAGAPVAQAEPEDAGAALAEVIDAGAPEPEAQVATLELKVDPPVSISLNGEEKGRSPLSLSVQPGRYLVTLKDKARGIATSRTVVVPAGGASESIYLQKGYVSVSAPDGSHVFIDGRRVGVAPLKDVGVYEGSHRILVTVGKARWSQAFTVSANERMFFEVELNEP